MSNHWDDELVSLPTKKKVLTSDTEMIGRSGDVRSILGGRDTPEIQRIVFAGGYKVERAQSDWTLVVVISNFLSDANDANESHS